MRVIDTPAGDDMAEISLSSPITILSTKADGRIPNGFSFTGELSPDGSKLAFTSLASDLVAGDTNGGGQYQIYDLFVKDLVSGEITRVMKTNGSQPTFSVDNFEFSPDGTRLLFTSSGHSPAVISTANLYSYDLASSQVTQVAGTPDESVSGPLSRGSSIDYVGDVFSEDGQFVVFSSTQPNLIAADQSNDTAARYISDIFIKNLTTGDVKLVSSTSNGAALDDHSYGASISNDGKFVAFRTSADNILGFEAESGSSYTVVKNLETGEAKVIGDRRDGYVVISPDGKYVAYTNPESQAQNDRNAISDLYVKDIATGEARCVSVDENDEAVGVFRDLAFTWSPDGKSIAFASDSAKLFGGLGIYVKNIETGDLTCVTTGLNGNFQRPTGGNPISFSADGSEILFTVIVKDGSRSVTQVVSRELFATGPKPQGPTGLLLDNDAVDEGTRSTAFKVGVLSAIDPTLNDIFTYELASDPTGSFVITGDELRFKGGVFRDFETKSAYDLSIKVTDAGGESFVKTFTVKLRDVNEAPDISTPIKSVSEALGAGAAVGPILHGDPDRGDAVTLMIVKDSSRKFEIEGGVLQLKDGETLDFETGKKHKLVIEATDAEGLKDTLSVRLNVTDVNERPTDIVLANNDVDETAPAGAKIAKLNVLDQDFKDKAIVTVLEADSPFTVKDGFLVVKAGAELDFETRPHWEVTLRAVDKGGLVHDERVTIEVNDVNERPNDVALIGGPVSEAAKAGTVIGTLRATDPDGGESFTYEVSSSFLKVVGDKLVLTQAGRLDFERNPTETVRIVVTDHDGLKFADEVTINVSNDVDIVGTNKADQLKGGDYADQIRGLQGDDTIQGGGGVDIIVGGQGVDSVTGGAGADVFCFLARSEFGDVVTDFVSGVDRFRFSTKALGGINQSAIELYVDASPTDRGPSMLFSSSTHVLSFDEDGKGPGEATILAVLEKATTISLSDFDVI